MTLTDCLWLQTKIQPPREGNWCGDNQRLGSVEQQYGQVNWSGTLRSDVWGDEMV